MLVGVVARVQAFVNATKHDKMLHRYTLHHHHTGPARYKSNFMTVFSVICFFSHQVHPASAQLQHRGEAVRVHVESYCSLSLELVGCLRVGVHHSMRVHR